MRLLYGLVKNDFVWWACLLSFTYSVSDEVGEILQGFFVVLQTSFKPPATPLETCRPTTDLLQTPYASYTQGM